MLDQLENNFLIENDDKSKTLPFDGHILKYT